MPAPSRNEIYDAVIRRMVMQALDEQELHFTRDHAFDSDEQLIAYLQDNANRLQHSPRFKEIVGWKLMEERFGDWNAALRAAGLSIPSTKYPISKLPRIEAEVERQKVIYRQKKADKKVRAQKRLKAQNEKKKQKL